VPPPIAITLLEAKIDEFEPLLPPPLLLLTPAPPAPTITVMRDPMVIGNAVFATYPPAPPPPHPKLGAAAPAPPPANNRYSTELSGPRGADGGGIYVTPESVAPPVNIIGILFPS
jgi:hypothetical protein